jgi:hypothetical protein
MQARSPFTGNSSISFKAAFGNLVGSRTVSTIVGYCGIPLFRPPKLSAHELVAVLVFHCVQSCGTLAENIRMLTGKRVAKSSLSERRKNRGGRRLSESPFTI